MIVFKRKKIKLSLIEDYIKIILIKKFTENNFNEFLMDENSLTTLKTIKILSFNLEQIYINVFNELKMNDLSLLILKKELNNNNSLFFQNKNIVSVLNNNYSIIKNIYFNAYEKFKLLKLKFNHFLFFSLCTNISPTLNAER